MYKGKYKQVLRHVWEEYKEMALDYRHHFDVKEIYRQRPAHIERVFADGKMKFGLTKTYFRSKRESSQRTYSSLCLHEFEEVCITS